MDREKMIADICDDMRSWLKRDPGSFWEHVADLEGSYLREKSDEELADIHLESRD